jgi:hypothetical protein
MDRDRSRRYSRLMRQFPVAAVFLLLIHAAQAQSLEDLLPGKTKLDAVEYKGRKAIRMTVNAEGEGLALLRDTEFSDGTIEADVAVKMTTALDVRNPGFIGIAFRSRSDAKHYEMFYIRPGNSHAPDQAMRNHVVQYVQSPDFDWYKLRRTWPWAYEAHADLQPEEWIRIRIQVEGRRASLFLNGASNAALVVDGLKGEDLKGGVGLWGSPDQESYFSNVRITHAKPQPVQKGGEVAGAWQIHYGSDAGQFDVAMKLRREGATVSGTASGLMGTDLPVTGLWRNGYLELTFQGTWTQRDPGDATARLAGWIDGNAAKGRMIVNGRADGVWSGTRKD